MPRWKLPTITIDNNLSLFEERLEPKPHTSSYKVLEALKRAGHYGQTNYELQQAGGLSWHRRVGDLRAQGHNIRVERLSKGVFKYYLEQE